MALISDPSSIGNGRRTGFDVTSRMELDGTQTVLISETLEWTGLTRDCASDVAANNAGSTSFLYSVSEASVEKLRITRTKQYSSREDQRVVGSAILTLTVDTEVMSNSNGNAATITPASGSQGSYSFNASVTAPSGSDSDDPTYYIRMDLYGGSLTASTGTWNGTGANNVSIPRESILFTYTQIDGVNTVNSSNLRVYS